MTPVQLTLGDVPSAQAVVKAMLTAGADKHPALVELRRDVFRGGTLWVMYTEAGLPVSINCTKLGKRRSNAWEPYANWYSAYTLPAHRRTGLATDLYRVAEAAAVAAGCRRIKSLAGSSAGLGLHLHLKHACWGTTANGEVFVDSALPGFESFYQDLGAPAQAPSGLMGVRDIKTLIKKGLRYDKDPTP